MRWFVLSKIEGIVITLVSIYLIAPLVFVFSLIDLS